MRLLSAFVLAFLCLNLGGALCLTYCSQIMAAASASDADEHLSEHCKRAKERAQELEKDSTKLEAGEASCCMMPVAFFAAPVEKRPELSVAAFAAAQVPVRFEAVHAGALAVEAPPVPVYRPPPLDHRVDRILHSVFRI